MLKLVGPPAPGKDCPSPDSPPKFHRFLAGPVLQQCIVRIPVGPGGASKILPAQRANLPPVQLADIFPIILFNGAARRADYIPEMRGSHFHHNVKHLLPREALNCAIGYFHFPRADAEDR